MKNTSNEIVELQVKPTKNSLLEVTNEVKEWLYDALENPYYQAYYVSKDKDGSVKLELKPKRFSLYRSEEEKRLWKNAKLIRDPSVEFSEKRIENEEWNAEKKEVTWLESAVFTRDFNKYYLANMDWIITLSNWNFLINKYGKYEPNLSFLSNTPEVKFQRINKRELNFDEWCFSVLYWEFFISKKWTKCFRILPKDAAKHILICDSWWWAFEKYRWRTLPEDKSVYYRRASSNWWWYWYDYWVYDTNFKNEVSEDEI